MKIEYLKEFFALTEYLNFTQTAEHLYITQPALSRHIALMEEELGMPLLKRTTKSVELTQAGAMLRDVLPGILEQYDSVVNQMKNLDHRGKRVLRFGIPAVAVNDYLGRVPAIFREKYPDVELSFVSDEPEMNIAALLRGDLDLIMIAHIPFPNAGQLTFQDYITEPLVVICKDDDPLARKTRVKLEDLENYTFLCNDSPYYSVIWDKIRMQCQWSGFTPRMPMFYKQMDAVLVSVRQGLGVTIVGAHHRTLATQGLTYVVLDEESCFRKLSVAYRSSDHNPLIPCFIDIFARYGGETLRKWDLKDYDVK